MNRDLGEIAANRYEALWHDGPVGAFVTDANGKWLAVNSRWVEITGVSEEQAIAERGLRNHLAPEDAAALNDAWTHVLTTGERFRVRIRFEHADRGTRYLAATAVAVVDDDGKRTGVLGTLFDETDQRLAELSLRSSEDLLRVAFDSAPIGMAIADLDERFRRVNEAMQEMLGLSEAELLAGATIDIIHPEDLRAARDAIARVKVAGEATADLRFVGGGGRIIWVELRATLICDEAENPLHILAQLQDVTERRQLIARLEHLVTHDPLTGLANRRGLETALAAQIAVNERYGERGCLMIIDIDNFKGVNDTLGHAVGDDLIVAAANALRLRLRESDVVARLGGDEFAVILPEQDVSSAVSVACDLNAEIAAQARAIGAGLDNITASIGLTSLCSTGMNSEEALRRGDQAMYSAKHGGKNRVALYGDISTTTGIPTGSAARSELSKSS